MGEDWVRDEESARRIRERTEKLSTAAKYSHEPPALLLDFYEFREDERLTCPRCGWTGQAAKANREPHTELFDISCPRCEKMLMIVSHPTIEETKRAAAGGNDAAKGELSRINKMEARWARAAELALKTDSDLPELNQTKLQFVWDFAEADGETWTIIRHADRVIWRELAYWEGWERFNEVKAILKSRYGDAFTSLEPTSESELYLFGDSTSAPWSLHSVTRARPSDHRR